ncbi:hypothetical protein AU186_21690 [Mycobacterium sp. GA-1999]|nr:hypothetical protein AU185_04870 [Mycobacterium sp. GA-0227b]KUH84522.1 hypothetical protein AU186_21690 [Mycobacterium sp. GA-1999]KUH89421.1 hypothetical protein AU187_09735 [Mycobacterium sp. IS-1556]
MTDNEAWDMIAAARSGVLTTLRRDGRPVPLPVWHVTDHEAIYVQTPSRSKKLRRIAHDPRGSFLVEEGAAWAELRAVVLPVQCRTLTDVAQSAERLAAIAEKYADHTISAELLPPPVAANYADMVVVELVPDGPPLSWNNAALLGK